MPDEEYPFLRYNLYKDRSITGNNKKKVLFCTEFCSDKLLHFFFKTLL